MEIIETRIFTDEITKLLSDDEYQELQNFLVEHPNSGDIIKGSGGLRKLRWKLKSKGKSSMKKSELIYTFSLDLGWFSHDTAKKVVELAKDRGLIQEKDDEIVPTFDLDEIEIPIDFKPDLSKIFASSAFDLIIQEISEKTGKNIGEVIAMINKKQEELGNLLSIEVVALIIAKELGIDISRYIEDVEAEILKS